MILHPREPKKPDGPVNRMESPPVRKFLLLRVVGFLIDLFFCVFLTFVTLAHAGPAWAIGVCVLACVFMIWVHVYEHALAKGGYYDRG